MSKQLQKEIQRRRTFGIISHPDAGKTTLTEKLLLFGGAIQMAGAVKARKASKHALSDWMSIEKERGISVTSSVMKFEYADCDINLLDTPGHQDFSEDTYRVLTAVDSALMVIDGAKGVETQTQKLMEVCRLRNTPIITFINKMDRDCLPPLDILADIEDKLQIECSPLSWPIGMGKRFKGVYNLYDKKLHLFTAGKAKRSEDGVVINDLSDPLLNELLESQAGELREEIALLEGAANPFDLKEYLKAGQTPVFFGSAINNFGVKELLDAFVEIAPPPVARPTTTRIVKPEEDDFAGFVFKIQANMDPAHRDRIAFMRVVSGKFERDMIATHSRTGKKVRLSSSHKLFANERETVNAAFPGDIIGLVGHSEFGIGDTLSTDPQIIYHEIPRFPPESFSYLRNPSTAKYKQFRKGLDQLLQEGVVQLLRFKDATVNVPLLAAVGPLQFEVVQYRLQSEYGAESQLEPAPWQTIRWLPKDVSDADWGRGLPTGARLAFDADDNPVVLFANEWSVNYFSEINPKIPLEKLPTAPQTSPVASA